MLDFRIAVGPWAVHAEGDYHEGTDRFLVEFADVRHTFGISTAAVKGEDERELSHAAAVVLVTITIGAWGVEFVAAFGAVGDDISVIPHSTLGRPYTGNNCGMQSKEEEEALPVDGRHQGGF